MGIGKDEKPSNDDKCLICYGPHSPAGQAKRNEKGITFELKNLKDILMKILGIQFPPHFSKYGSIHMCYDCHDEFLKVEKIHDEAEHGAHENNHNFDAVREQFAFIIVDSIITSGYICNYVHGNAFDALRYLVFKEWSGKFRKQEELKKGKQPVKIPPPASKPELAPKPLTIPTPVPVPTVSAAPAEEASFSKKKVQNVTSVSKTLPQHPVALPQPVPSAPTPPPPPPPPLPPQKVIATPNRQIKSTPTATVVKPVITTTTTTTTTISKAEPVKTSPAPAPAPAPAVLLASPAKPASKAEPAKQLPAEVIQSKPTGDSSKKTTLLVGEDSVIVKEGSDSSSSPSSVNKSPPAPAKAAIAVSVSVNGKSEAGDYNDKSSEKFGLINSLTVIPPAEPVVTQIVANVEKSLPETEGQTNKVEPEMEECALKTPQPGPPTPPKLPEDVETLTTTTKKTDDPQTVNTTNITEQSESNPEEPLKPTNKAPVSNVPVCAVAPTSATPISTANIVNSNSTYILSSDGQRLLSKSGKLQQNHKLIFVRRDPKTGKMVQVPKPNLDMVRGKLNGKEVIVRTAPPSSSMPKPTVSIVNANTQIALTPSQLMEPATIKPAYGVVSYRGEANANKNPDSPLTPKIVSVHTVRQEEFNSNKRKDSMKQPSDTSDEAVKTTTYNLQNLNSQKQIEADDKEVEDCITKAEKFGLEISDVESADVDPEQLQSTPSQEQLLALKQKQQLSDKKQQGRPIPKSPRSSSSEESLSSSQSQDVEIRSVRSGRRIKRVYDSSSSWASGVEMEQLVNQCVKADRTERVISPGKKAKYEVHRHGNLIIEPLEDPIGNPSSPSPPVLDNETLEPPPAPENEGEVED